MKISSKFYGLLFYKPSRFLKLVLLRQTKFLSGLSGLRSMFYLYLLYSEIINCSFLLIESQPSNYQISLVLPDADWMAFEFSSWQTFFDQHKTHMFFPIKQFILITTPLKSKINIHPPNRYNTRREKGGSIRHPLCSSGLFYHWLRFFYYCGDFFIIVAIFWKPNLS